MISLTQLAPMGKLKKWLADTVEYSLSLLLEQEAGLQSKCHMLAACIC